MNSTKEVQDLSTENHKKLLKEITEGQNPRGKPVSRLGANAAESSPTREPRAPAKRRLPFPELGEGPESHRELLQCSSLGTLHTRSSQSYACSLNII